MIDCDKQYDDGVSGKRGSFPSDCFPHVLGSNSEALSISLSLLTDVLEMFQLCRGFSKDNVGCHLVLSDVIV